MPGFPNIWSSRSTPACLNHASGTSLPSRARTTLSAGRMPNPAANPAANLAAPLADPAAAPVLPPVPAVRGAPKGDPAGKVAGSADNDAGNTGNTGSSAADAGKQALILVVDDVPDNLDILVDVLSDHYQVRAANSGERALKALAGGKLPDLILLDVMMPGMDGL